MLNGGGMALLDQGVFLGWVRAGQIQQILNRMAEIIPVYGQIEAITRTYQYQGNTCFEGRVKVY